MKILMPLLLARYPLEENVRENEAEDARCLAIVEDLIQQAVSYASSYRVASFSLHKHFFFFPIC